MKQFIKDYLSYSKSDRNGLLVLVFIIIALILFNIIMPYLFKPKKQDFTEFNKMVDEFEASLEDPDENYNENRLDRLVQEKYDTIQLFKFDPNATCEEDWILLGLSEKQIRTINNYIKKGGRFYEKQDLSKIYGVRKMQYEILEPYITIDHQALKREKPSSLQNASDEFNQQPDIRLFEFNPNTASNDEWLSLGLPQKLINTINKYKESGGKFNKKQDLKKIYGLRNEQYEVLEPYIVFEVPEKDKNKTIDETEYHTIELNTATEEQLLKLKGIGTTFASRIIKYKNILGGFAKKQQLLEVYGLTKEIYEQIHEYIVVDDTKITKHNINFEEISSLKKHPYINYQTAKTIIDYRSKNGSYQSIDVLIKQGIIEQSTYEKLEPYITIQ